MAIAATSAAADVIDLTGSPEPIVISDDDDDDAGPGPSTAKKRRKRKTKKKGGASASASGAATPSAHTGGEDAAAQTARSRASSPGVRATAAVGPSAQALRRRSAPPSRIRQDAGSSAAQAAVGKEQEGVEEEEEEEGEAPLFFIDVAPASVPAPEEFAERSPPEPKTKDVNGLLLPDHVGLGNGDEDAVAANLPTPPPDSDGEDYIEYLQYDDTVRNTAVRYFEAYKEENKTIKVVCKKCGAEGEHKTFECPVLICLTCGARDEHSTRSCPISKTCYTCGMKGHINRTCPNRHSRARPSRDDYYDDCDRCGSQEHRYNECPTLWRIYTYVTDEDLKEREAKRDFKLGEGGEGYISDEEWCYNCGGAGHWGDDCEDIPFAPDFPREPSAFSAYNIMSGPFYDPAAESSARSKPRRAREPSEEPEMFIPGRNARQKEVDRMVKRARAADEEEDDANDWFANARNVRNRGMESHLGARVGRPLSSAGPRIRFGGKGRGGGASTSANANTNANAKDKRQFKQPSPPPLLERLGDRHEGGSRKRRRSPERGGGDSFSIRGAAEREEHWRGYMGRDWRDRDRDKDRDRDRERDRDRNRDRRRDRDRDRDRDKGRDRDRGRREDFGPRYKGGYSQ